MSTSVRGLRVLAAGLRLRLRDRPALPMAVAGILRLVTPVNDGDSVMMLRLGVEARTSESESQSSRVAESHVNVSVDSRCFVRGHGSARIGLDVRASGAGGSMVCSCPPAQCCRLCSDNMSTGARGG